MKNYFKKFMILLLVAAMILPSPLEAIAVASSPKTNNLKLELQKLPTGETAEDFIKNPEQPDIYTMRNEYKVERYDKKEVNYQPYVATVGAAATPAEQAKVNKTITLPDFLGYDKPKDNNNQPIENFNITYQGIKKAATGAGGAQTGNDEDGVTKKASREFLYQAKNGDIKVKHVFQDLNDFTKYGNKPGETGETITEQTGRVGSLVPVKPLKDDQIEGFVPENKGMKVLITEKVNTVDLRYNRAHYDVVYDTTEGTPVPTRTLYYEQEIPPP